jgi:DNA-binding response OmpR family regulator
LDIIRNAKPDLVLLDIMLPGGMNGFDVLEEIRGDENTAKLKVIVMSNLDSEEKEARLIGVEDYIIKANTSIDEVMKKIANILSV